MVDRWNNPEVRADKFQAQKKLVIQGYLMPGMNPVLACIITNAAANFTCFSLRFFFFFSADFPSFAVSIDASSSLSAAMHL